MMKNVKLLLSAALALVGMTALAQQDFSSPQFAKWGATPEEREQNILNSNFLKEEVDNRNYDKAAFYLKEMIDKCPEVQEATYQRGATIYRNKINRAKSIAEKNVYIDSLMLIYDLRAKYFSDHPKRGLGYILDQKARDYMAFRPSDRAGIRKMFREAINAGGDDASPETVVAYYSILCDDYQNTDQVMPEEVIEEYNRLLPYFEKNLDAAEYRTQFDAAFSKSGAASCEDLEKVFKARLEAEPDNETLLGQAVAVMANAECNGDFFFSIAEKYYLVNPSSDTALFLAQGFQGRGEYDKAIKYLNEALDSEEDPAKREGLLVQISLVDMMSNNYAGAASAARQVRDMNPDNGIAYFVLAQCYAASAANCSGFSGQAAFWVAYDTMAQAVSRLENEPKYFETARKALNSYRAHFPTSEECFFNELKEGARYTVTCGLANGISTTVRPR